MTLGEGAETGPDSWNSLPFLHLPLCHPPAPPRLPPSGPLLGIGANSPELCPLIHGRWPANKLLPPPPLGCSAEILSPEHPPGTQATRFQPHLRRFHFCHRFLSFHRNFRSHLAIDPPPPPPAPPSSSLSSPFSPLFLGHIDPLRHLGPTFPVRGCRRDR